MRRSGFKTNIKTTLIVQFYAIAPTIDDVDKLSPDENPDDEMFGMLENDDA